jgi:voltage-gated potassium channel
VAHELEITGRACVIIDSDALSLQKYLESHPSQLYLQGDATDNDVLLAAGLLKARGVFAVAHDDNDNLVISLSVKQLNPNLRVVARCHDLKNAEKSRRAGADEIVSPDFTGGLRLVSAMVRPQVVNFLDELQKSEDGLRMEEVVLPPNLQGKNLLDLRFGGQDLMVLAIRKQRGQWIFNPPEKHPLQGDEIMMVMTTPDGRNRIEKLLQGIMV